MKRPEIKIEGEFIVIHNYIPDNDWATYDFGIDRFRTRKDLEEWVEHLKRKIWFTPALEAELRLIFNKINGKE